MALVRCRVATVREKNLENEKISRSGKIAGNIIFSQGNLEKMENVREFQNFPKKILVNRLLDKLQAMLEMECF